MASSKRERELARLRAERQAARRAEAAAARRRRNAVIASVVAVVLVAGVGTAVALARKDNTSPAAAAPLSSTSASAGASASPSAAPGSCTYAKGGPAAKKAPLPPALARHKGTVTTVLTTNRGEVDLALDAAKTPCTTNSFTSLARSGYFDATSCHRLTTSGIFVLQCGDPTGTGSGGPGYRFADENLTGATYPAGTVAMANSGPGTNGSQFFLVYKGGSQLSPNYTPFGRITKGLDVLTAVAKAGAVGGPDGKPKQPLTLTKVAVTG